ncbi:HEL166Wp [Eremothecium sinecaudum]|uniref:ATP-dependent RNA helicase n=1 Tax=Eremothecium sinecaudum TaxID=45286 RepID=A0A0X8HTC5_9SACH|nr:HEL166Wp [Eremothecium sinecaudum]AMD21115.1 HEL166Wp [Eremothecium sinecaudum]
MRAFSAKLVPVLGVSRVIGGSSNGINTVRVFIQSVRYYNDRRSDNRYNDRNVDNYNDRKPDNYTNRHYTMRNSRSRSRDNVYLRDADYKRPERHIDLKTFDEEENYQNVSIKSMVDEGLLDKPILRAFEGLGYKQLSPVQQRAIKPSLKSSEDLVVRAKTGTGKTMAFLIPIMQKLLNAGRGPRKTHGSVKAVIIAPTRDLALQIESEIHKLQDQSRELSYLSTVSCVGGTSMRMNVTRLQSMRPDIVVGTPGRLLDLLQNYEKFFTNVDIKVLDEADTLLEIGFKSELETISERLNELNQEGKKHIRTMLYSATLSEKVESLAGNIINKDTCYYINTVSKEDSQSHEKINQSLVLSEDFASSLVAVVKELNDLVATGKQVKAMLFLPTVKMVSLYSSMLERVLPNLRVLEMHGKLSMNRRERIVRDFKRLSNGVFVTTDVGARGMDFPNVTHVLQLGVPTQVENYVHRIGRTARAGKDGEAIMFLMEDELHFLDILKRESKTVIKNQRKFVLENEIAASTFDNLKEIRNDLEASILSVLSHYRSRASIYNFPFDVYKNIASSYGKILGDESKKIIVKGRDISNFISSNDMRYAHDIFEIVGSLNGGSYKNKSNSNRRRSGGNVRRW